jgi:hypothetical protein
MIHPQVTQQVSQPVAPEGSMAAAAPADASRIIRATSPVPMTVLEAPGPEELAVSGLLCWDGGWGVVLALQGRELPSSMGGGGSKQGRCHCEPQFCWTVVLMHKLAHTGLLFQLQSLWMFVRSAGCAQGDWRGSVTFVFMRIGCPKLAVSISMQQTVLFAPHSRILPVPSQCLSCFLCLVWSYDASCPIACP